MNRRRPFRTLFRVAVLLMVVCLSAAVLGAQHPTRADAAIAAPAEIVCDLTCTNVPPTAQAAAQSLMTSYGNGTFIVEWAERAIIPNEIQPIADGTIAQTPQCGIDARTLQTLVILIRNYGSVQISDLNRHCANDGVATCASNPTSRHCVPSGATSAIDITYIGQRRTRGNDEPSAMLLQFVDTFIPAGSRAGQASGGDDCGVYTMPWVANITRFVDYCTHLHVDLGASTAPLRNLH